jgi:hypothetical protein
MYLSCIIILYYKKLPLLESYISLGWNETTKIFTPLIF